MAAIQVALGFGFLLVTVLPAYPHGGGLDAYGCHNNRKAGGYHCRRGPLAGQSFNSKEEMLDKLSAEKSGHIEEAHDTPETVTFTSNGRRRRVAIDSRRHRRGRTRKLTGVEGIDFVRCRICSARRGKRKAGRAKSAFPQVVAEW